MVVKQGGSRRLLHWVVVFSFVVAFSAVASAAKLSIAPGWNTIPAQMESTLAAFQEKTGIQLEVARPSGDYHTVLKVWYAAGAMPDVFFVEGPRLAEFVNLGALLPLDEYVERDVDKSLYLPVFDAATVDGVLYGFPALASYRIWALWVNRNIFRAAGMDVPGPKIEDALSFDQVAEVAGRLTVDKDGDGKAEQYGMTWPIGLTSYRVLLPSNGALFFSPEGDEVLLDRPEAIEVFSWLQDGTLRGWLVNGPAQLFAQGLSALDLRFRNETTWQSQIGDSFDWSATPVPAGRAGSVGVLNANPLAISSTSTQPDLAWEFIKFVISEEVQEMWAAQGTSTIFRSIALRNLYFDHPPYDLTPFYEGDTVAMSMGLIPPAGLAWPDEVTRMLNAVVNGQTAPEIGVVEAANRLRALLREASQ